MRPLKRVLVVDDEPKICKFLKEFLELHHYEVVTASNGLEALECVKQQPMDLILLDVVMPELDGWQVLTQLKHHEPTRSIPVIMLTAKGDANALLNSQRLGAADHFIKPFNPNELLGFLRRYL